MQEIESARHGRFDGFEDSDRAALEFAAALCRRSDEIPDPLFERLRRHYSDPAIVEITAVAGLFTYFNRFNNALRVPPTQ